MNYIPNIENSRSLPANISNINKPVINSSVDPKVTKVKKQGGKKVLPTSPITAIISRAAGIAFEALPLVSMVSPQLAFAGNFAGLSVRTLISLKNNNKFDALVTTASAVGFYANPLLTAQVLHSASGVNKLYNAAQQLWNKQYAKAGKSLVESAYSIVYVGVLTTANPQLIAISLVAQAAFSFARAYQFGLTPEGAINTLIGGLNGFAAYSRTTDLLVSSEKYQSAFIEFKDAVVCKATEVLATVSQIDLTEQANKIQNIKFENVTGWAKENAIIVGEFVKTSFEKLFQAIEIREELRKIDFSDEIISVFKKVAARLEQNDDYYISKEGFDDFLEDMAEMKSTMKEQISAEKYSVFEACCKRILSSLVWHIKLDAPSSDDFDMD